MTCREVLVWGLVMFLIGGCSMHRREASSTPPGLSQIADLSGVWMSEPDRKGSREEVRYRVTSGGSAVEEILFPGTAHEMISVYTQEPRGLAMTHYCMLRNQPKLLARQAGPNEIIFTFAGGEGIDPGRDEHMHELRLTKLGPDRIRQEWTGWKDGKPADTKVMVLRRQV